MEFFSDEIEENATSIDITRPDVEEESLTVRKERRFITRNLIENFIQLLVSGSYSMKKIQEILNISHSSSTRLYKRYLAGEFLDLSKFEASTDKKKKNKQEYQNEKNIIATEMAMNPCQTLTSLSEKPGVFNNDSNYSKSTVCRILKAMNYSRKILFWFLLIVTVTKTRSLGTNMPTSLTISKMKN